MIQMTGWRIVLSRVGGRNETSVFGWGWDCLCSVWD